MPIDLDNYYTYPKGEIVGPLPEGYNEIIDPSTGQVTRYPSSFQELAETENSWQKLVHFVHGQMQRHERGSPKYREYFAKLKSCSNNLGILLEAALGECLVHEDGLVYMKGIYYKKED